MAKAHKSCTSSGCKRWAKGFETSRLVQHEFLHQTLCTTRSCKLKHSLMNAMERENRQGKESRSWSSRAPVEELRLQKPQSGHHYLPFATTSLTLRVLCLVLPCRGCLSLCLTLPGGHHIKGSILQIPPLSIDLFRGRVSSSIFGLVLVTWMLYSKLWLVWVLGLETHFLFQELSLVGELSSPTQHLRLKNGDLCLPFSCSITLFLRVLPSTCLRDLLACNCKLEPQKWKSKRSVSTSNCVIRRRSWLHITTLLVCAFCVRNFANKEQNAQLVLEVRAVHLAECEFAQKRVRREEDRKKLDVLSRHLPSSPLLRGRSREGSLA